MASSSGNDVDDVIRDLRRIPGFASYAILNNDGIVIKYENIPYKTAVYYAHQVLSLTTKAKKHIADLLEYPDNEVESIRMRTGEYEMIIAQHGNFTIIVSQNAARTDTVAKASGAVGAGAGGEEKKEGEEKKDKEG